MDAALRPLVLSPGLSDLALFNLDLHTGDTLQTLRSYFHFCCQCRDLFVTTSCFAAWKKEKCTNGSAKLIPAVPAGGCGGNGAPGGEPCCVFFFDDNINLHLASAGAPGTKGICNLRDVNTGEYIDFSVGSNGFVCERLFRHTLVHHSTRYRNVLVQANILEAMSNADYFTSIIEKYSHPGEKLIIYMDVNGTILWSDSIMGLGPTELVLEAMASLTQVRPKAAFEFVWPDCPPVKVEKPVDLKQLMNDISRDNKQVFASHLKLDTAVGMLRILEPRAEFGWGELVETFSPEEFGSAFDAYMVELRKQDSGEGVVGHGITRSWFRCLQKCKEAGHALVINSFGMDTQAVVRRSTPEEASRVMHVAVNFEMWSERDTTKFLAQFQEEERTWAASASSRAGVAASASAAGGAPLAPQDSRTQADQVGDASASSSSTAKAPKGAEANPLMQGKTCGRCKRGFVGSGESCAECAGKAPEGGSAPLQCARCAAVLSAPGDLCTDCRSKGGPLGSLPTEAAGAPRASAAAAAASDATAPTFRFAPSTRQAGAAAGYPVGGAEPQGVQA